MTTDAANDSSLFRIQVSWPLEYMPMVNDLIRIASIQITAQCMYWLINGEMLFSGMFVQMLCFLLLGVLVYWLIIHKLIRFETTQFSPAKTLTPQTSGNADVEGTGNAEAESEGSSEAGSAEDANTEISTGSEDIDTLETNEHVKTE